MALLLDFFLFILLKWVFVCFYWISWIIVFFQLKFIMLSSAIRIILWQFLFTHLSFNLHHQYIIYFTHSSCRWEYHPFLLLTWYIFPSRGQNKKKNFSAQFKSILCREKVLICLWANLRSPIMNFWKINGFKNLMKMIFFVVFKKVTIYESHVFKNKNFFFLILKFRYFEIL